MRTKLAAAAVLTLGLGLACRDSTVPTGPTLTGARAAVAAVAAGSTTQFVIRPSGSTVNLFGVFRLSVPAGSVCDPAIGGGCVPITAPVAVTATIKETNGRVWVDFQPHLDFVNSPARNTWVTISTDLYADYITANRIAISSNRSLLRKYGILYAASIGGLPIDEVATLGDRSLNTRFSVKTGRLWRRILHFSGYHIITEEECEPTPGDPYCIEIDDDPEPDEEDI
jgi:hypothetical protein